MDQLMPFEKPRGVPAQLVPSAQSLAVTGDLETSIQGISAPLAGFLSTLGLPTERVLVDFGERRFVLQSLQQTLEVLPCGERAKAYYLSKFSVAVSVGLFDAALNFLWDETILALRRLAASMDISYFFDTAEKRESYRAKLQTSDDLAILDDFTLIDTCARVELLSDVNRERLRHVNYMRNHASAAHPNQNDLTGQEMTAWLSNCLRCAITAKPDHAVVVTKQLLTNIRAGLIPEADIPVIAADFDNFTHERIDDLLWTLFGLYVDPNQKGETRANIAHLAPYVWRLASEDRRYQVGARHEHFIKQADQERKVFADEFLIHVDGQQYRSEDVLAGELLDKLRSLLAAHNGMNNFYNEWPHAASLQSSLPVTGVVPRAARLEWVKVITKCHIGNGFGSRGGVDQSADNYYQNYIANFGEREVVQFLGLFGDPEFTVDFSRPQADARARRLISSFKDKTRNIHVIRALDALMAQPQNLLRSVTVVTKFKESLNNLPKPAG
jgi:hypothetical protein